MKKMKIRISKQGKTTIQVEGASGPECVEFTKLVENAVGSAEKRTLPKITKMRSGKGSILMCRKGRTYDGKFLCR